MAPTATGPSRFPSPRLARPPPAPLPALLRALADWAPCCHPSPRWCCPHPLLFVRAPPRAQDQGLTGAWTAAPLPELFPTLPPVAAVSSQPACPVFLSLWHHPACSTSYLISPPAPHENVGCMGAGTVTLLGLCEHCTCPGRLGQRRSSVAANESRGTAAGTQPPALPFAASSPGAGSCAPPGHAEGGGQGPEGLRLRPRPSPAPVHHQVCPGSFSPSPLGARVGRDGVAGPGGEEELWGAPISVPSPLTPARECVWRPRGAEVSGLSGLTKATCWELAEPGLRVQCSCHCHRVPSRVWGGGIWG